MPHEIEIEGDVLSAMLFQNCDAGDLLADKAEYSDEEFAEKRINDLPCHIRQV